MIIRTALSILNAAYIFLILKDMFTLDPDEQKPVIIGYLIVIATLLTDVIMILR